MKPAGIFLGYVPRSLGSETRPSLTIFRPSLMSTPEKLGKSMHCLRSCQLLESTCIFHLLLISRQSSLTRSNSGEMGWMNSTQLCLCVQLWI